MSPQRSALATVLEKAVLEQFFRSVPSVAKSWMSHMSCVNSDLVPSAGCDVKDGQGESSSGHRSICSRPQESSGWSSQVRDSAGSVPAWAILAGSPELKMARGLEAHHPLHLAKDAPRVRGCEHRSACGWGATHGRARCTPLPSGASSAAVAGRSMQNSL